MAEDQTRSYMNEMTTSDREKPSGFSDQRALMPHGLDTYVSVMITDLNDENARILSASQGAEKLFSYEPGQMEGLLLSNVLVPDRVHVLPELFSSLNEDTGNTYSADTVLARRSGELFPAHIKAHPLCDQNGDMTRALFFITDLSYHKELEKELSRSEQKFRILVENSLDIITILDGNGRVTYFSPSVRDVLEYESEEGKNVNAFDYIHPKDFPATMSILAEILKDPGSPRVLEHRVRDARGEWRTLESRGKALVSGSGLEGIIVNSRDITERKEAEKELARTLSFEEAISEISRSFVFAEELGPAIDVSLEKIGRFSSASRAYVFYIDAGQGVMRNTHEWCAPGIESQKDRLQSLPLDMFPWWIKKLSDDGVILVQELEELPDEASSEKAILQEQGIMSLLVLPFYSGGHIRGYVGFDNVLSRWVWEDKDLRLLRIYANLLGQAFEKDETLSSYRSSLEFNLRLLNSSPNPIMVLDSEGAVSYVNPSFGDLTGYSLRDIKGMRPPFPWWPSTEIETCFKDHHAMCRGQASSGERSFVASGNIPIRVLVSSARIKGEDGDDHYLVNWLDITERYQVQEALRESEEKYRSLIENLNEIVYSLNRDGHITFISPLVTSVLGYEPGEMEGHSFTSFVHEKDRVMVEESLKDRWAGITEKYEVRMLDKKGRIHYLFLSSRPQFEGNNVVGAIGAISDITDQREAEIKLEASYKKLDSIMDGTALSMVSLLEIRDPHSAGHQRRVSILATAIAIEMGLPEEQVERIRIASLVHDIGKIHIPSEILSKPSPLRKTEFELLKGHPAAGAEIISRFAFPEDISTIVHQHHERLDGSGYPDGLKGDEILFEARILAVADVVEAMVSHRPYRPAHSFDEALEEISSRSGTLYDPAVVEACVKVFSRKGIFNPDPVM
jgi:PAS domain S-box-containing protein/putative nucleotidyltransferase with HDIG domain